MAKCAALGACAVALLPLAAADAWLQSGHDAARTAFSTDAGPAWDDVAFTIPLLAPGEATEGTPNVFVRGRTAYVDLSLDDGTTKATRDTPDTARDVLLRVDLDTMAVRRELEPEGQMGIVAMDDARIYIEYYGRVDAYELDGGELLWTWEPPRGPGIGLTSCTAPAILPEAVVLGCDQAAPASSALFILPLSSFVVRLDPESGEERWRWQRPSVAAAPASGDVPFTNGIAVVEDTVIAVITENGARPSARVDRLFALDLADGTLRWTADNDATNAVYGVTTDAAAESTRLPGTPVAGRGTSLYAKGDDLRRYDVTDGTLLGTASFGSPPLSAAQASSIAIAEGRVLASTETTLRSFDPVTLDAQWDLSVAAPEFFDWRVLAAARDAAYATTYTVDDPSQVFLGTFAKTAVLAADLGTGVLRWRHEFDGGINYALGDGTLVAVTRSGNLTVLGASAASIRVAATVSDVHPAPGEPTRVDLADTGPGALGPATSFLADWGDGTVSEWQESPVLAHAYAEPGDVTARLQARNDAGQTASEFVTFHVGAEPPNLVSVAFSPENQERTFFLLGLALTGAGALFGVTRVGAKRRRLARELAAIDKVHAATRHDPPACDKALAERKAHARGLLVDAKIDEAQFALLERRIDELARDLRLAALDERFQFLPLGMVRQLHEMLADGRVTEWEREHFETALERERTMSDEQKANVRALVEEWFARDAGDGAGDPGRGAK
ncbi:MAG TPA: PQQ-binding-like beta-propeller repeat protein [Candidatus Thermoplasmatota archaeon]|nr:PQQ-binding-like beta-propeller repeat protein [Candidatus Thermoplasmatota archaeon]